MSKTQTLIRLLESRAGDPQNPYPYVAGFLSSLLEQFEMEDDRVEKILDQEIARVKKLKQGEL